MKSKKAPPSSPPPANTPYITISDSDEECPKVPREPVAHRNQFPVEHLESCLSGSLTVVDCLHMHTNAQLGLLEKLALYQQGGKDRGGYFGYLGYCLACFNTARTTSHERVDNFSAIAQLSAANTKMVNLLDEVKDLEAHLSLVCTGLRNYRLNVEQGLGTTAAVLRGNSQSTSIAGGEPSKQTPKEAVVLDRRSQFPHVASERLSIQEQTTSTVIKRKNPSIQATGVTPSNQGQRNLRQLTSIEKIEKHRITMKAIEKQERINGIYTGGPKIGTTKSSQNNQLQLKNSASQVAFKHAGLTQVCHKTGMRDTTAPNRPQNSKRDPLPLKRLFTPVSGKVPPINIDEVRATTLNTVSKNRAVTGGVHNPNHHTPSTYTYVNRTATGGNLPEPLSFRRESKLVASLSKAVKTVGHRQGNDDGGLLPDLHPPVGSNENYQSSQPDDSSNGFLSSYGDSDDSLEVDPSCLGVHALKKARRGGEQIPSSPISCRNIDLLDEVLTTEGYNVLERKALCEGFAKFQGSSRPYRIKQFYGGNVGFPLWSRSLSDIQNVCAKMEQTPTVQE